jgi:hypothetical protein
MITVPLFIVFAFLWFSMQPNKPRKHYRAPRKHYARIKDIPDNEKSKFEQEYSDWDKNFWRSTKKENVSCNE